MPALNYLSDLAFVLCAGLLGAGVIILTAKGFAQ